MYIGKRELLIILEWVLLIASMLIVYSKNRAGATWQYWAYWICVMAAINVHDMI